MLNITFKSTPQVIVDIKTLQQAHVYMEVQSVRFTGALYMADIMYYWIKEEVIDGISYSHKMPMQKLSPAMSTAQITAIQSSLTMPTDFNDMFLALITAACAYQLGADPVFGLTGNDWSVV